jgi:hypothetical protein
VQTFYLSPPASWPFKSPTIPAKLMPSRTSYTRNAQGLVLVDQSDLSTLLGLGFYLYGSTPDLNDFVSNLDNSGDATKYLNGVGTLSTPTGGDLVLISDTSRMLFSSDDGATLVFSSGSGITLTVPAGLGAGFGCVIVQNGAGQITPTAVGVTIASRQSYTKTAGQYAVMSLLAAAADTFILFGDGA